MRFGLPGAPSPHDAKSVLRATLLLEVVRVSIQNAELFARAPRRRSLTERFIFLSHVLVQN